MSELQTINEIPNKDNVNRFHPKLSKQQKILLDYIHDDKNEFRERTLKKLCYHLLETKTGRYPRYDEAHYRLTHFLAELRVEPSEEVAWGDIYDEEVYSNTCRLKGVKSKVVRSDLIKEANCVRASVSQSLKRLYERGLIVKAQVDAYHSLTLKKILLSTLYFSSREQCQKLVDEDIWIGLKSGTVTVHNDVEEV